MTVSTVESMFQSFGDGSTLTFSFNAPLPSATGLTVILTDPTTETDFPQTLGSNYTLTGDLDPETGVYKNGVTIVFAVAPTVGYIVTRLRELEVTQELDFKEADSFPAVRNEAGLDKVTMLIQQMMEDHRRAILFKVTSLLRDVEFPSPDAAKFLRWNATEDGLENAAISTSGALSNPVAIAEGGTAATTIATAQANLQLHLLSVYKTERFI